MHDPHGPNRLVVRASHAVYGYLVNVSCPVGFPVIGLAVSKRRGVVVSDFAAAVGQPLVSTVDEQIEDLGSYLEVRRPGPQSQDAAQRKHNQRLALIYPTIAAVPLVARDEVYGALVLYYHA